MFLIICGALFTSFIAYIIYTLATSYGSEYADNSIEAFIDDSVTDVPVTKCANVQKAYTWHYDQPGRQLLILYGTEYGFSEEIARKLFDRIEEGISEDDEFPWQPRIVNAKYHEDVDLTQEQVVFIVISTAGDGVPPTEARGFWDRLASCSESYVQLHYSVLALGDSNYVHYCRCGRNVDQRLVDLGAKCAVPRQDVDTEDWAVINVWIDNVLQVISTLNIEPSVDYLQIIEGDRDSGPNRNQPFMATLRVKRSLTTQVTSDDKQTIHCEFDLTGSGITWTSGDALGLYPENNPPEVQRTLRAMNCSGEMAVDVPKWAYQPQPAGVLMPLEVALLRYYDLKMVKPELVRLLQMHAIGTAHEVELSSLLKEGLSKKNHFLLEYLAEREVSDVLQDFHEVAAALKAADILGQMKPLQPRYYSISSSPIVDADHCHVTAAIVRYSTLGFDRTGVCTTFLQDRLDVGQTCPAFISQNPEFRLPEDGSAPIIMVGPGTGIAPFMAFISERLHTGARGKNYFYFGCRHRDKDFLYREQLESWAASGLVKLRAAFSRDQPHKIYVQDLIREDKAVVWDLLTEGAHVYICGDAKHMAHDVHQALLDVLQSEGKMDEGEAASHLTQLAAVGQYQKDVWVT